MDGICMSGRVAPIAKSPLDAARGRRKSPGLVRITEEELADRLVEYLREAQIQKLRQTKS